MQNESAYFVGRKLSSWPDPVTPSEEVLIASEFMDNQVIKGLVFKHCTFANISFKEAEIASCSFTNCVFVACYFRKAILRDVQFDGCRFIQCDFPRVAIHSCGFRYSKFDQCFIPFNEIEHSLPMEPNLRRDLAVELALATESQGQLSDARKFRLEAIEAKNQHLWAAVKGASEWYRSHFDFLARAFALFQLMGSRLNGLLWGHGERWPYLIGNLITWTFLIFPSALWLLRSGLSPQTPSPSFGDLVWLSVATMIPGGGSSELIPADLGTRFLLTAEAFAGVVFAGLFISLLINTLTRR